MQRRIQLFTRKELNYLRDPYFRIIREEDQYIVKDIQEQKYYKLTATEIKNFNLKFKNREEKIIDYINLAVDTEKFLEPYYTILNSEAPIFRTFDRLYEMIEKIKTSGKLYNV